MIPHLTQHRAGTLIALALVLLSAAEPALAKDKTEYSHGEFEQALLEAKRTAKAGPGDPSEVIQGIDPHDGGWQATIHGAWQFTADKIQWMTFPALVYNQGDRLEYAFYGQPMDQPLIEAVRNHKFMRKAEQVWLKEHKDIQMVVGIDSNRVTLTATYSYAKGVSLGDIAKRLEWLFKCSSSLLVNTAYAHREVGHDFVQALEGRKLTHLSRAELVMLVDDGLDEWVSKSHQAAEGAWDFKYQKRSIYILNHGKSIDFAHRYNIPESVQGEKRQQVLQAVQEYVSKKKMAKASRQEATWPDAEKQDATWVKISFDLDGNIKGEELKKAYFDFYQKYTQDLQRAIEKIVEDHS